MIKNFVLGLSISFFLVTTKAVADQSQFLKMTRYQIVLSSGNVVAFRSDGWGFVGCPLARQVVISSTDDGFDAAFSTIMLSYSNDEEILFGGNCVLDNGSPTDIVNATSVLTPNQ